MITIIIGQAVTRMAVAHRLGCRACVCGVDVINVFLRFLFRSRFLTFFLFSTFFYLKKTLSNAKYKYIKIQRKIFSEDHLAMIFIDSGLLRSLYCKISYLLAEEH